MDAEDSPTAGLRNGLRSAVGCVFASRMIHPLMRCIVAHGDQDALDEVPPSNFVYSAPDAERSDDRIARHFPAINLSIRGC